MRAGSVPPRGSQTTGKIARVIGLAGMLLGIAIIVGTATGAVKTLDTSVSYLIGGTTTAYGLFRYLLSDRRRPPQGPSV